MKMEKLKKKVAIVGTRTPSVSYSEWEKLLLAEIDVEEISLVGSTYVYGEHGEIKSTR